MKTSDILFYCFVTVACLYEYLILDGGFIWMVFLALAIGIEFILDSLMKIHLEIKDLREEIRR